MHAKSITAFEDRWTVPKASLRYLKTVETSTQIINSLLIDEMPFIVSVSYLFFIQDGLNLKFKNIG